jgi:hypothetical protein
MIHKLDELDSNEKSALCEALAERNTLSTHAITFLIPIYQGNLNPKGTIQNIVCFSINHFSDSGNKYLASEYRFIKQDVTNLREEVKNLDSEIKIRTVTLVAVDQKWLKPDLLPDLLYVKDSNSLNSNNDQWVTYQIFPLKTAIQDEFYTPALLLLKT